jgi:ABC-type nitrate/sulfonate/bicarbonate transport system substrate-binding protein
VTPIRFSLLRGVCQIPAYVAHEKQLFAAHGIESTLNVEPTAWMVPQKLVGGDSQFAVMPWTRVAAGEERDVPLLLVCGSGCEEAAIVVRKGVEIADVRRVAVPLRGGMKDLTAMALIEDLGWKGVELLRQPSGDGAIISLFGQGADAASMVEPYATMMEALDVGRVVRRSGDVWRGAPGCSLTTTAGLRERAPETVAAVVRAFVEGARFTAANPEESAEIASRYIGVNARFIAQALGRNQPNPDAIRNDEAMARVLTLMRELGYIQGSPSNYKDLRFLDACTHGRAHVAGAGA